MSSLSNLKKRISYSGGATVQDRMKQDKLVSLKAAMMNSYQRATAVLQDGREFNCLINPDKLKPAYDNQILSIPYEDICLNRPMVGKTNQGFQKTGLKLGDTFLWKETNTHWLLYLQDINEIAYLKTQIRRCDQQVEIGGKKYWAYIRGPVQTDIRWNQKAKVEWNDLNRSLVMFVKKDQNTMQQLHRFAKIKVPDSSNKLKTWQVANEDVYYGDGIIQVFLMEDYQNTIEEQAKVEKQIKESLKPNNYEIGDPHILGPKEVTAYSTNIYTIQAIDKGEWFVKINNHAARSFGFNNSIMIDVNQKYGNILISYVTETQRVDLPVKIQSV